MQSRRGYPENSMNDQSIENSGNRIHHVPIYVESRGDTLNGRSTRANQNYNDRNEKRVHNIQPRNQSPNDRSRRSNSAFTQYRQSPPSFYPQSGENERDFNDTFNSDEFSKHYDINQPDFKPRFTTYREPREFTGNSRYSTSSPGQSQRQDHARWPGSHQTFNDSGVVSPGSNEQMHPLRTEEFYKNSRSPVQSKSNKSAPKSTVINVPTPVQSQPKDNVTIVPINKRDTNKPDDGPPKVIPLYSPEPTEPQSPPPSTTPIPLPPPPCPHQNMAKSEKETCSMNEMESIHSHLKKGKVRDPEPIDGMSVAKPDTPIPMPPPESILKQDQMSDHDFNKLKIDLSKEERKNCGKKETDQLYAIRGIEAEVEKFVVEIDGTKDMEFRDKKYRYLDEMLTRCMLRLDKIDCGSNEELRQARKMAIRTVNSAINHLESKVEAEVTKY